MKIVLLFLSIVPWFCLSQKPAGMVHVRAVNPCTQAVDSTFEWKLKNAAGKVVFSSNPLSRGMQIATLYEDGDYYIHEQFGLIESAIGKIHVSLNDTIYMHTVYLPILAQSFCVCNPPDQKYYRCGEPANGSVTDYYSDACVRISGTFQNGLPVDTLRQYSVDGILVHRESPEGEGLFHQEDFDATGKLVYEYSQKNRYTKSYTDSTAAFVFWDKKSRYRYENYRNGHLIRATTNENDVCFDTNGREVSFMNRTEIGKWDRLFSRNWQDRHFYFFEYTWTVYAGEGVKTEVIFLSGENFSDGRPFPKNAEDVLPGSVQHFYVYQDEQLVAHYVPDTHKMNQQKNHRKDNKTAVHILSEKEIAAMLKEKFQLDATLSH